MEATGKALKIYASKTAEQAKNLQAANPESLCFANDRNQIVFDGHVYGVVKLPGITISGNVTAEQVTTLLGAPTTANLGVLRTYNERGIPMLAEIGGQTALISLDEPSANSFNLKFIANDTSYSIGLSANNATWNVVGQNNRSITEKTTVVNNLTSTSTTSALSAAQGKSLKDTINNTKDVIDSLGVNVDHMSDRLVGLASDVDTLTTYDELDALTIPDDATATSLVRRVFIISSRDELDYPPHIARMGHIFVQRSTYMLCKTFIGFKQDDSDDRGELLPCCEKYLGNGSFGINHAWPVIAQTTGQSTSSVMSQKAITEAIQQALGSVYKAKGTKQTIAEVIALTDAKVGDVWNVASEFVLSNNRYPAGTNVVCVTATSPSSHTDANWDPLGGTITGMLTSSDIVNSLTSTATNKALSAVQGKTLNDKVVALSPVNNLTSTSTTAPLAAAQGKALDAKIKSVSDSLIIQ